MGSHSRSSSKRSHRRQRSKSYNSDSASVSDHGSYDSDSSYSSHERSSGKRSSRDDSRRRGSKSRHKRDSEDDDSDGRKKRKVTEEDIAEYLGKKAQKKVARVAKKLKENVISCYSIDSNPFGDSNLGEKHAHSDDPGRDEWEGFPSGTKAATAGGITTLIDMPLNSFPSTVSRETLQLKIEAAKKRIYVDVGFWGGLVPENAFNASALEALLSAGVLGLKSFMCPSGINDFPMTNTSHIQVGLSELAKYGRPLLVHSEFE